MVRLKITLKPVGNIDSKIMEEIRKGLNHIFGCPVEIRPGFNQLAHAYDRKREQYHSSMLIASLETLGKERDEKILGIADVDLYAPGLNFVFGEADIGSGTAIISLCRLRQEFYGLPPDKKLFIPRAIKEATHELGHTFGLGHCPNSRCVMHFSNSLADTDYKELNFCQNCYPKVIPWL
jgi:archaemetzincin